MVGWWFSVGIGDAGREYMALRFSGSSSSSSSSRSRVRRWSTLWNRMEGWSGVCGSFWVDLGSDGLGLCWVCRFKRSISTSSSILRKSAILCGDNCM